MKFFPHNKNNKHKDRTVSGHRTYLDASVGMFLGAQEERAIDQGVSIEDQHRLLAQDARHATLLLRRQRGQDEEARLVVAMIALVLNLQRREGNDKTKEPVNTF